jgi:hypothetical protein
MHVTRVEPAGNCCSGDEINRLGKSTPKPFVGGHALKIKRNNRLLDNGQDYEDNNECMIN